MTGGLEHMFEAGMPDDPQIMAWREQVSQRLDAGEAIDHILERLRRDGASQAQSVCVLSPRLGLSQAQRATACSRVWSDQPGWAAAVRRYRRAGGDFH